MRRNKFFTLMTGLGAVACLGTAGCNDYLSGQDQEPEGPIQITKLVLFDNFVRDPDVPVLTDTSSPESCMGVEVTDTSDKGKACNGPFGDRFHPTNNPVNTESGTDIRVVFNKLPFKLGSRDLDTVTKEPNRPPTKLATDQSALSLMCVSDCSGAPGGLVVNQPTGSTLSADPDGSVNGVPIPFGPSIQFITGGGDDPLATLEPGATYRVVVNPELADRSGNRVSLDARAQQLLTFKVGEPWLVRQVGLGDGNDELVYSEPTNLSYEVEGLPNNGVLVLQLNAPLDDTLFRADSVTVTGGGMGLKAALAWNQYDGMACDPGNGRFIYIYPDPDNTDPEMRSWGAAAADLTITIRGNDIGNLAQDTNHTPGMGKNRLTGKSIVIKAKMTGMPAGAMYEGLTADVVLPSKNSTVTMLGKKCP